MSAKTERGLSQSAAAGKHKAKRTAGGPVPGGALRVGTTRGPGAETTRVGYWKSVADEMPDSEQTVLYYAPEADEPVWLGFHDGECWRQVSAEQVEAEVTHWMQLPEPPSV